MMTLTRSHVFTSGLVTYLPSDLQSDTTSAVLCTLRMQQCPVQVNEHGLFSGVAMF